VRAARDIARSTLPEVGAQIDERQRRIRSVLVCRGDPSGRSGADERVRSTLRGLVRLGDVEVIALSHDAPRPSVAVDDRCIPVRWARLTSRAISPIDILPAVLGISARRASAARSVRQRRELAPLFVTPYDLVWAFTEKSLRGVPRRAWRESAIVFDLNDVEDQRDVALARTARRHRWLRAAMARRDGVAMRRSLRRLVVRADVSVVSSEVDRDRLGRAEVRVLDNAYRRAGDPVGRPEAERPAVTFTFIGLMSYGPNADGVGWLRDEIWPLVRAELPDARLRIVGRGAQERSDEGAGIVVVGEVSSVLPELEGATAVVAPLRAGSGTRIKILEGWAHRVPVVSTTIGAEGLGAIHGTNVMIADEPVAFASALVRVARDPELRQRLAEAGEAVWRSRFRAEAIADDVVEIARAALATRSGR